MSAGARTVDSWTARLFGIRPLEARALDEALARDQRRRSELRAHESGLSARSLEVLLGLYLGLAGLGCAGAALLLRAEPGRAALELLAVLSLFALGLSFGELFKVLLADEGFRVIAAWPVRSQSFLWARLAEPTRRLFRAMLLLASPPALALALASGVPIVTGAVFWAVAVAGALSTLWVVAAVYSALLRALGAARARRVGTLLQIAGLVAPLVAGALMKQLPPAWSDFASAPRWSPLTWNAALVVATTGRLAARDLWMLLAAAAWLLVLPVAAFRLTARHYTRGLLTARVERSRPPWTPPTAWVLWLLRRPSDRVVLRLVEAHARLDWRFRAQVTALPALLAALVLASAGGLHVQALFADPLRVRGVWHPAMIFVAVALVQPVLALPMMSASAEHGAAWILRAGTLPQSSYLQSGRRIVRVLFLLPTLIGVAAGYLWARAPLFSVALHLLTLALLSEVVARTVQRAFPHLPFARPVNDEEVVQTFAAAFMLAYVLCGLVALFVVHVLYRVVGALS